MSEYKMTGDDALWAALVTLLFLACCVSHSWGGVAFWGACDVAVVIRHVGRRIEHVIREAAMTERNNV